MLGADRNGRASHPRAVTIFMIASMEIRLMRNRANADLFPAVACLLQPEIGLRSRYLCENLGSCTAITRILRRTFY